MLPRRFLITFLILLMATLTLSGCKMPVAPPPTADPGKSGAILPATQTAQSIEEVIATPTATTQAAEAPATPIPATATAVPRQVAFEGVRIAIPQGLAADAGGRVLPASGEMPSLFPQPQGIELELTGYTPLHMPYPPLILVFPVQAYREVHPNAADVFAQLEPLFSNRPQEPGVIPGLYRNEGAPLVQTNLKYLDFKNGEGARFITQFAMSPTPLNNNELFYIYQGLTSNGEYYVLATMPVSLPILPANAQEPAPPDGVAFPPLNSANFDAEYDLYRASISEKLNLSKDEEFTPSLALLDALMSSIDVQPLNLSPTEVPPTAAQPTQAPPTPGGPTPVANDPGCTNAAKFESETVRDGSEFTGGQVFIKTWKLRNTGSCTWTTEYALVFVDGNQMSAPASTWLAGNVPPNSSVDLAVTLTAPQTAGEYRGNWMLKSPTGKVFGLGKDAASPFFVEIAVTESREVSGPDLGEPDWVDTFKNAKNWYVGKDENVEFAVEKDALVMTAFTNTGDYWRVAQLGELRDFYVEASFITGAGCRGKDSYGLLVRGQETKNNIVNGGYVFGFSCDGKYRFYRMENGTYYGVQNWTTAPNFKAGPNASNLIGIRAEGDMLQVTINGGLIAEFTDSNFDRGLLGLMIRSSETINFQVKVDEVKVWKLK